MITMDDDDDYFTPMSTSSRRLAMLFGSEDMATTTTTTNSITGHQSDLSAQFRFVAPKQPRPGRSSSSSSTSSVPSQVSSRDGQDVLLEVVLNLLPQGTERNGMGKTQVRCQVVGNAVRRSFTLVVVQDKEELWKAAVDSQLLLEVVERSTLRVAVHGRSLTLLGDTQRIEALVMQLAIYRGVASNGPTHQDLCVGKGHVLGEGDVAKVCCTTYTITSTAHKGEKVDDLKGVKVAVSPATGGRWERCLAGATTDTHRLIFLPKQKDGKWLPPTTYHDVTVMKVKTKGSKEKAAPGTPAPTAPAPAPGAPPVINNNSPAKQQQQQHIVTSHDASASPSSQFVVGQNGDLAQPQGHDTQEEDGAARKAALVSRMAQVGTALFPLMPSAKVVPRQSEATTQGTVESQETLTESTSDLASTSPPTPSTTLASNSTSTLVSTSVTTSTSTSTTSLTCTPTSVLTTTITTTAPAPAPILPASHLTPSLPLDPTLALSICQLGTSVAKMSDRIDLLLAKVDGVEGGVGRGSSSSSTSDPEALMALAKGLVDHNERLRGDVEAMERKLVESQTSCTSLLAMNTELLEEKREMLRREAELRKEEDAKKEDDKEDLKDKQQPVKEEQVEDNQTQAKEDIHGLTPEQVRSLLKFTLSGLFRHLSSAFSEEEQYTRPQILHTVRSGLEVAYSSLIENLEEMAGVEGEAVVEGGEKEENQCEGDEKKEEEEENGKSQPQIEVKSGKSSPESV